MHTNCERRAKEPTSLKITLTFAPLRPLLCHAVERVGVTKQRSDGLTDQPIGRSQFHQPTYPPGTRARLSDILDASLASMRRTIPRVTPTKGGPKRQVSLLGANRSLNLFVRGCLCSGNEQHLVNCVGSRGPSAGRPYFFFFKTENNASMIPVEP